MEPLARLAASAYPPANVQLSGSCRTAGTDTFSDGIFSDEGKRRGLPGESP
jgi:hypothetical protein